MNNADSVLHLHRIVANANSLKEGLFWPRWYPNLYLGYGYPLGNYYPPGASLIGGFFVLLGFDPIMALLLLQTLAIILMASGGYLFAREFGSPLAAFLATAVYLYTPFLFFQLYSIGNTPQLFGLGILPWAFWAIAHCAKNPNRGNAALIALFLGLMTISHHIIAFYALPAAGIYTMAAAFAATKGLRRRVWKHYGYPLAGYWLGFFLVSAYWLPAVFEAKHIKPINTSATGNVSVERNFVLEKDLFGAPQVVDQAAMIPFFRINIGYPQLGLYAIGLLFVIIGWRFLTRWQWLTLLYGLAVIGGSVYLITYHSFWLWKAIPGLELFQQPWRLLGLVYILLLPIAAIIFDYLLHGKRVWGFPIILVITIGCILPIYYPYNGAITTPQEAITPASNIDYEIETGNFGTVAFKEYLPVQVESSTGFSPCYNCYDDWEWQIYPEETQIPANVSIQGQEGERRRSTDFSIEADEPFQLVFHQFYFPGWQATLDGHPITLQTTQPHGLLAVNIPQGKHQLIVWYAGTPPQTNAEWLSIFTVMILLALWIGQLRQRMKRFAAQTKPTYVPTSREQTTPFTSRAIGYLTIIVILIFTLVNGLYLKPHTDIFRKAGTVDTPLYIENTLNTVWIDPTTAQPTLALIGYDLNVEKTVQDGDWVYLDLYWRTFQPQTINWRVKVAFGDVVYNVPWIESDTSAPGIIPTSGWSPERYVFDRHILKIDDQIPPYVGNLTVMVYSLAPAIILQTPSGETQALITTLRIDETQEISIPAKAKRVSVTYGDMLRLQAYQARETNDQVILDLYWEVLKTPSQDYRLFIHFWGNASFLEAADRPPIDIYPTSQWQTGQLLHTSYTLPQVPNSDTLFIGIYEPNAGNRLEARGEGINSDYNALSIPLKRNG